MLFVSRERRAALELPVLLLAMALPMLVAGSVMLRQQKFQHLAIGALSFIALLVHTASRLRYVRLADGVIRISTGFTTKQLRPEQTAISIRHSGTRSVTYLVYVTDGQERSDVSEHVTQKAAARARAKLTVTFLDPAHDRTRSELQRELNAAQETWERPLRDAQAQVDAYYASGAFRRTGFWIAGGLVLYVVGMSLYVWLSGGKL